MNYIIPIALSSSNFMIINLCNINLKKLIPFHSTVNNMSMIGLSNAHEKIVYGI